MSPEQSGQENPDFSEVIDQAEKILQDNIEYLKSHIDAGSRDEDPHLQQMVDLGTAEQDYLAVLYLDSMGKFCERTPESTLIKLHVHKKRDPRNLQRFIYSINRAVPGPAGYPQGVEAVVATMLKEWNSLDSSAQDFGENVDKKLGAALGSLLGTLQ